MEKISLYDQNNDKMYDVMLSVEDARRAALDITFATSLLNAAILEENKAKQNEDVLTVHNNTQSDILQVSDTNQQTATTPHNDIQSTDSCEENSLYRWSEACVLLLLRTYETMEEKFTNGKFSHKKCWELVAAELKKHGYSITGPQCSSKFRSLKKTYKTIKDHNAVSGNDRRTWQHFEIMDQMFSKRAWCKPVALASSTGQLIKNINMAEYATSSEFSHDESFSDKENEPPKKKTKAAKMSMTELLEKRIIQKEDHENKRQKRHDDKMLIESKLVDTLTQYLSNK